MSDSQLRSFVACLAMAATIALSLASWFPAHAQSAPTPPDYYKGRTLTIIVGFSAGGSFDLYARTLSRHFGRNIPGNPTIVVQNMPGAGSLKAVDYLYTVAPRDGTVIATFNHTVPIEPLLGRAKFDPRQLQWIGSVASESSVCLSNSTSPVKSLDDLQRMPFTMGGTGRGSDTDMFANVIKTSLGMPLRLVTGYPGTLEIMLAVQRGEVDGLCGIFYSSLVVGYPELISSGKIKVLVQAGIERDPALSNAPMIFDYAKNEQQRQILMLLIGPQVMARPFAMPPGTPAPQAEILRRAFQATMKDPAFVAETSTSKMAVSPVGAAKIAEVLEELYRTPPAVLSEAIRAFGE